jgi:hypothetical protein
MQVNIPFWLLRSLPMWEYQCPYCKTIVAKGSDCPNCRAVFNAEKWRIPPRKTTQQKIVLAYFAEIAKIKLPVFESSKAMCDYAHNILAPMLSDEDRGVLFQFFTTLFSDNEVFATPTWTGTLDGGGTLTVQSTIKYEGTYAAKFDVTTAGQYKTLYKTLASAYSPLYARSYVYFTATPASGHYMMVYPEIEDNPITKGLVTATIANVSGTLKWGLMYWTDSAQTSSYAATPAPAINTWHCDEVLFKKATGVGANNGEVALWVNGPSLVDITNVDNDTLTAQTVTVGCYIDAALTVSVYHDAFVAADASIGVLGQPYVSRVQQVAGMNSWTRQVQQNKNRFHLPVIRRRF